MNRDKEDAVFTLSSSMNSFDEDELEGTDFEPGYHPTTNQFKSNFLVVRRKTTREKAGRGRGRRPDSLNLEVFKLDDVSVHQMRKWKDSDSVEMEELTPNELWNRVLDDDEEFIDRKELREGNQ